LGSGVGALEVPGLQSVPGSGCESRHTGGFQIMEPRSPNHGARIPNHKPGIAGGSPNHGARIAKSWLQDRVIWRSWLHDLESCVRDLRSCPSDCHEEDAVTSGPVRTRKVQTLNTPTQCPVNCTSCHNKWTGVRRARKGLTMPCLTALHLMPRQVDGRTKSAQRDVSANGYPGAANNDPLFNVCNLPKEPGTANCN
jgi:hypothetical protein